MDEAEIDHTILSENMVKLNKSRPRSREGKFKKQNFFDSVNAFYESWELTL